MSGTRSSSAPALAPFRLLAWQNWSGLIYLVCAAISLNACTPMARNSTTVPIADIHLHFNWDQKEIISANEALQQLRDNHVVLGVVSSTPTELALELSAASDGLVIPFFSPYLTQQHKSMWFTDQQVLIRATQGIESGDYKGIGEVHLWGGMAPKPDHPIFVGLLRLAEKHQVPLLLHTEASSHLFFQSICQQWPGVRFIWAHAGGRLKPNELQPVLDTCGNVWMDLSVRDPWRYDTLATEQGQLSRDWIDLLARYPDRFMIGSDPVWSVTRGQRWDQADEGWDYLQQLLAYHRRWLAQLPADIVDKIASQNALSFFGRAKDGH